MHQTVALLVSVVFLPRRRQRQVKDAEKLDQLSEHKRGAVAETVQPCGQRRRARQTTRVSGSSNRAKQWL